MLEKLQEIERRYEELNQLLSDPTVVSNHEQYREYAKEHSSIEPIVYGHRNLSKINTELEDNKKLLRETDDLELRELAQQEISELKERKEKLQQELLLLLIPKDPNDEKNIILEIRAGTGGDEAALFAGDLFAMYAKYAERYKWKVEILSYSESSVGGYKEVIARIDGKSAFSHYKYERGTHRVQRVPKTETQGRIHTSAVTVAVLPEAKDVEIQVDEKDLRIDVFRASGPGGQSVNTTDSAVRITHEPTGLVVICQDEKSQFKNKAKAMTVLRARLLDMKQREADAERREDRRAQIGTGERSEKIRTYNFPQSRVTDHRIGLNLYQLSEVLAGNLDLLFQPLATYYKDEALKGVEKN